MIPTIIKRKNINNNCVREAVTNKQIGIPIFALMNILFLHQIYLDSS